MLISIIQSVSVSTRNNKKKLKFFLLWNTKKKNNNNKQPGSENFWQNTMYKFNCLRNYLLLLYLHQKTRNKRRHDDDDDYFDTYVCISTDSNRSIRSESTKNNHILEWFLHIHIWVSFVEFYWIVTIEISLYLHFFCYIRKWMIRINKCVFFFFK